MCRNLFLCVFEARQISHTFISFICTVGMLQRENKRRKEVLWGGVRDVPVCLWWREDPSAEGCWYKTCTDTRENQCKMTWCALKTEGSRRIRMLTAGILRARLGCLAWYNLFFWEVDLQISQCLQSLVQVGSPRNKSFPKSKDVLRFYGLKEPDGKAGPEGGANALKDVRGGGEEEESRRSGKTTVCSWGRFGGFTEPAWFGKFCSESWN